MRLVHASGVPGKGADVGQACADESRADSTDPAVPGAGGHAIGGESDSMAPREES